MLAFISLDILIFSRIAYQHWIVSGKAELRQSIPDFNARFYLETYADLKAAFGSNYRAAYQYWQNSSINEVRLLHP
ncbi:MAG: hypothetical protein COA42_01835 [Alteromonadaceae bacterium]|nr:MAG: hypothetical protein COA42_01835 [Alteromonadaceae bacterium]